MVPTGHVSVVFWGSKNNTVQSRCEIEDILDYHTLCSINLWVRGLRFRTTSYHNELSFPQAMSQKSAREPPGRQAPQLAWNSGFGKPPNQLQLFGVSAMGIPTKHIHSMASSTRFNLTTEPVPFSANGFIRFRADAQLFGLSRVDLCTTSYNHMIWVYLKKV